MAGHNTGLKVLVILLLIISIALGAGGYYMLKKEQDKSAQLGQDLDAMSRKYRDAQSEIEQKATQISGLESSLDRANNEMSRLNSRLSEEQSARKDAVAKLDQLRADLAKQTGLASDLAKKLSDSENTIKDYDKRLKEMESQLKAVESKKAELETKAKAGEEKEKSGNVELGKIVVTPDAPEGSNKKESVNKAASKASASKPLAGRVLVLNKDYKFAVINLGSKDGVTPGMIFSVQRNNKAIGELKVEKVHETMSAAGFVYPELKDKISEGDSVIQK
ncbi:MAG: hypothetical protein MUC52_00320 [Candidatus Omnitrophica bacterium]|nr:hypothetical protein [Candidatus Omnitrophota bacterium]